MKSMKIIDAHLHFASERYFDEIARAAGHINNEKHLRTEYEKRNFVHGIVMGNRPLEETDCVYLDFLSYCVGLDNMTRLFADVERAVTLVEQHLKKDACVGIKLYPGYHSFWIYDDRLAPIYRVAAKYHKPVAVHTGLTAGNNALLKYAHPAVMDEAATKFPDVQFVMCHFGEPYFTDAAAVLEKNPNVVADLSGILEGKKQDFAAFTKRIASYIHQLKGWLEYLDSYERFMFGTDWPLANLGDYVAFTKLIIPEEHWDEVFFDNANRIYDLGIQ